MAELPHIRYLHLVSEIYRRRRIGAAAEAANMSQPAATQALARIEEHVGVTLFERQPKGMVPTEAGALFERRLERVLAHLRRGDSLSRKKLARNSDRRPRTAFYRLCSPVQLRALLAVARTGSFNQAARDLKVSQPGIHRALRELASLSGLALFDQTRGGVIMTPAAEVFIHQVRLAASEFQQAIYEINELLGQDSTRINVGSLPLSRSSVLPISIDRLLSEAGSGVQVNCVDSRYQTLLRDLRFGELDFLIGALRHSLPANDIEQEELFIDELAVVTAPSHPLVQQRTVTFDDTLAFPWVAPPKDTPSGQYLFEKLRIQELPNTPVRVVSSSLVMLRGLLARGNYVSIASRLQIEVEEQLGQLVQLPIELPQSGRPIGFTFRTGWSPTPIQRRFLDIIREKCRALPPDTELR